MLGKSSLLRCLDLLLGASTAQLYARLTPEDLRDHSQSLVIEADLVGFSLDDEALLPDEINVDGQTGEKSLTARLEARFDSNQTLAVDRTAVGAGTNRQLSREQLAGIGWKLLSATLMTREIREDRRSALDEILRQVELGVEQADFDALVASLQQQLRDSAVLGGLRDELAEQLSRALPEHVGKDNLVFVPGATAERDVLSDVRLQVLKNGVSRNISEQSDGMRALYALALYDLVSVGRTSSVSTSRRSISTRRVSEASPVCCRARPTRRFSRLTQPTSSAPFLRTASSRSEAAVSSFNLEQHSSLTMSG